MLLRSKQILSSLLVPVVAALLIVPADLLAEDHVLTSGDLRNELRATATDRQDRISKIQRFLSTPEAERTLRSARLDPSQARQAVSLLGNEELARLAAQVDRTELAGAGISFTNEQVTIIIIGIILIVVIAIIASR